MSCFKYKGRFYPVEDKPRIEREEKLNELFAKCTHKYDVIELLASDSEVVDRLLDILVNENN